MAKEHIAFAKNPFPRVDTEGLNDFLEDCRKRGGSELADAIDAAYMDTCLKAIPSNPEGRVTVFGESDDLVEIEGAISEEFGAYDSGECTLAFDNGATVGIVYGEQGIWRVRLIALGSAELVEHYEVPHADEDDYSDRLTLKGDFRSVRFKRGEE